MTALLFLLVLLAVGVGLVWFGFAEPPSSRETRLRNDLHATDRSIARDHRDARRAMNDAAEQNWRNQFQ